MENSPSHFSVVESAKEKDHRLSLFLARALSFARALSASRARGDSQGALKERSKSEERALSLFIVVEHLLAIFLRQPRPQPTTNQNKTMSSSGDAAASSTPTTSPASFLLAVHCKKTEPVDLKTPIAQYAASSFAGAACEADLGDDLTSLQLLRNDAAGLGGSLSDLRGTLAKYYRALCLVEGRFPIGPSDDQCRVSFTWCDAFRASKKHEASSIHFEKAAILFNVGAALTQSALAVPERSATDAGLKEAARKFQEAAGVFAALRDGPGLKLEPPRPVDVGPECASMLERLCLAQAQELTFDKARLGGAGRGEGEGGKPASSSAVQARLAAGAAALYSEVGRALACQPLASHFDKSWSVHASVKAALYLGEAGAAAAAALHAADDIAPEIARLRDASASLAPARAQSKACARELADALSALDARLATALARAERENATVYLQRVPAISELPAISPAVLVKSITPTDLDAASEAENNGGLFHSVIPDSSAKALSQYTSRVDDLVRKAADDLCAASDSARVRLREWELPDCLDALNSSSSANDVSALPEGIRRELQEIADAGGVRALQDLVSQIKSLRAAAEADLQRVGADVDAEARDDESLRSRHGGPGRWDRPPSSALNAGLKEKLAGYGANLAAAGESDARLAQRLSDNAASFAKLLTPQAAAASLPPLRPPMVTVPGDVDPAAAVSSLRAALAAVDSLSAERAALEDALRAARNRDNPLPKMLAAGGASPEALFATELKKYDPLLARVSESVEKQSELMSTIEKAQADYKRLYGFDEWRRSCENAAAGARGAAETYRELRDNLGEGMRFYSSLREAVSGLAQQASDFTQARRLQRDDMVEALRRGSAAPPASNVPVYAPPPPQQYPPAPQWGAAPVAPPYGQQQQAPSPYAAAYAPPSYYQQQQPPPPPQGQQQPPPPSGGAGFNPLWNR